jgi:hypothetical protein
MVDDLLFVMRSESSSKHRRTLNDVEEHCEFPVGRLAWWVRRRYKDVVKICSVGLSILISDVHGSASGRGPAQAGPD